MHDFVVRERQHKVFAVLVNHAEGEQVVVVFAVYRIFLHVTQGVVHPAHVPFVLEAEAAAFGRVADTGESSAFFGDRGNAALFVLQDGVGALQEVDGFEVFAPAVAVRDPFTFFARVVAVDHGGDGVHTQTIHTIVFDPVEGVAGQEVAHFVAAKIVDEGVPVLMVAFTRIGVLVKRGAVEAVKTVFVSREVANNPVKEDMDTRIVRFFDEVTQFLRSTEAAGRRIEADRLVAPRAVKRKFGDGQQFDVGKAHLFDVGDKFVGKLGIAEPEVVFGVSAPGAEVDFIDADRRINAVRGDAFRVIGLAFRQTGNDGGGIRS